MNLGGGKFISENSLKRKANLGGNGQMCIVQGRGQSLDKIAMKVNYTKM